jgi:hypothetical protein
MSRLADFFKETHTALGVFYPLHCLVAVFPDLDAAQQVARKLRQAGFAEDEVIAVEGSEFIEFEKEETGPGNLLMQEISRDLGAEQVSTDHNLEFARRGAAFVLAHCPAEKTKKEVWSVMQPSAPLAAHYYSRASVDHLAGSFSTD